MVVEMKDQPELEARVGDGQVDAILPRQVDSVA